MVQFLRYLRVISPLLLLLPAPTNAAYPGKNYGSTLPTPTITTACLCRRDLGEGYSTRFQMCRRGSGTNCYECPYLGKCARMSTVAGTGQRMHAGDCPYFPDASKTFPDVSDPTQLVMKNCTTAKDAAFAHPVEVGDVTCINGKTLDS